jgi:hypothetical protein
VLVELFPYKEEYYIIYISLMMRELVPERRKLKDEA